MEARFDPSTDEWVYPDGRRERRTIGEPVAATKQSAPHEGMQLGGAPNVARPSLGRIVLVRTYGERINGQDEHAAIVTQVWSDTCINLTAFPGSGSPRGFSSVSHESLVPPEVGTGYVSWRWPPRV